MFVFSQTRAKCCSYEIKKIGLSLLAFVFVFRFLVTHAKYWDTNFLLFSYNLSYLYL